MTLTWLGHSCFLVQAEEATVVFDPYMPGKVPGLTLPPLTADLVISSHSHADHCCPEAVKLMKRRVELNITRMQTFHDDRHGQLRGENTVTVLELEGLRLAHMGDLGHMLSPQQIEELGSLDVLMIPVGGYYTIDATQARRLADALRPGVTIPMHYRGEGFGFDVISTVDEFAALSGEPRYISGSTIELSRRSEPCTMILSCK